MDTKKISFGFSKLTKKPPLLLNNKEKQENKVELIKCLEGHEIKLVVEKQSEAPLVIPLKEPQKTSAALASLLKRRAVLLGETDEPPPATETTTATNTNGNSLPPANETLEQRAARELLSQVQCNGDSADTNQNLVLPVLKPDEIPLDGANQSTIDDYESIPIEQFGRAMLRGMGWVEPPKQKKSSGTASEDMPFVRPKGMGLGADKALKAKSLLVPPEKNEVLEIKKQAYVRILGGKFKELYGQIEGFDDHAGRVIVKMAIGGTKEAFNEFLCLPVSKQEFVQYGKCINSAKYEEYKNMENEHGQIIRKQDMDEKVRIKKEEISQMKSERRHPYERDRDEKPSTSGRREYKHDEGDDKYHERTRIKEESHRRYANDNRDTSNSRPRKDGNEEYVKRHEHVDERHYNNRKLDEYSKRKSRERERDRDHSDSRERRVLSASSSVQRRQQYTDDTSASSGTDSDSDSAYERKHKKKSSHNKSKAKKKSSKKSKYRKHKHKRDSSDTEEDSNSDSDDDDKHRRRQHKKKTKKSKKPRSRTRSRSRSRSRSYSRTGKR